jgi:predicted nucleic acid-binding protein
VISVDTAVWIDHLHRSVPALVDALELEQVVVHPFVIGELACGSLGNRGEFLRLLSALPAAPVASHEEAMLFLEEHELMGRGLGYVDIHLLASAALGDGVVLWTTDRKLHAAAESLTLAK